MPTLSIANFSCLKDVTFTLSSINVIIGKQGSGKSVTTKLFYFFSDILNNFTQAAERGDSLESHKNYLLKQFSIWFPPSAWGCDKFNITYTADKFNIRILRKVSKGKMLDEISIVFSDWYKNTYKYALDMFEKSKKDVNESVSSEIQMNAIFDESYRVRMLINRKISQELDNKYIGSQIFIPAGRAFFTSIGRLVASLEAFGSLDPVTIKFAKLFANIRDRFSYRSYHMRKDKELEERRSEFMKKLFDGEVKFSKDLEYIETEDGRKIPFVALSSGQQELLPMWSLMDHLMELDAQMQSARGSKFQQLIYIEEPEAHLFPTAQSLLMEFLIGSIASKRKGRSLILTTHSPYIMGKLNVFLKAGQVGRKKKHHNAISEFVSKDCWLTTERLSVSLIEDGKTKNLIDEDGLIDSGYLDGISQDISMDFSKLLAIEFGQ